MVEELRKILSSNAEAKIWYADNDWVGPEYVIALGTKNIMTVYNKKDVDSFNENTEFIIHSVEDENICLTEDAALRQFAKTHDGNVYRLKSSPSSDEETWWYRLEDGDYERIIETKKLEDYKNGQ